MDLIDRQQLGYSVLDESDIKQRQEDDLTSVSTLLSLTKSESIILLGHYNWNVGEVLNQWFDGEEGIRSSLGLLKKPIDVNDFEPSECKEKITTCKICFESLPRKGFSSASCGHPFCFGCWGGYIGSTIKEHGRGCLSLRCPEPSCNAAVGKDMIDKLGSEEDKRRYSEYLLRSYVEDNKYIKWCPAPGCKYAIIQKIDCRNLDVTCVCGHSFCWNCNQESHRPVNCEVGKLIGERMSFSWIIEHCKACPKCRKPIEKDPKGCHHMRCSPPCNFEFCWLCQVKWSNKHGGGNECRIWEKNKSLLVELEAKRKRVMIAKLMSSDRKYYWESKGTVLDVNSSGQLEREQLIKKLTNSLGIVQLHENRLKFINDAWIQIGKCRHILRCTYAYGYSIPEHENGKKQFHQYLQEEAMSMLKKLHQCADKELKEFVDAKRTIKEFDCFTAKLIGLTRLELDYEALVNGHDAKPAKDYSLFGSKMRTFVDRFLEESWKKMSLAFTYDVLRPLYFPKNEEEVLFLIDGRLFLYNHRNGSRKDVNFGPTPAGCDMAFSIVESVVSLGMSKSREQGGISKQKRLKF
ncbi:Zinc finger, C6HC-type [Corchorus olitorius]|uniref:RBR-type E3 ubiquitin transferase n=1 Tax=Corchorus olitorius TaxID=93759 RepID=A0A1R3J156_9ROSI|nr:Zinc finger, C6HC-type [Corchorus olitorius]